PGGDVLAAVPGRAGRAVGERAALGDRLVHDLVGGGEGGRGGGGGDRGRRDQGGVADQDGGLDALPDQRHGGERAAQVGHDHRQVDRRGGPGVAAERGGVGVDRRLGGGGQVEPAERALHQGPDELLADEDRGPVDPAVRTL